MFFQFFLVKKPKLTDDEYLGYDYTKSTSNDAKIHLEQKYKKEKFKFEESTIRRNRIKVRTKTALAIKNEIKTWTGPLGAQFDGKSLPDLGKNASSKKYERLVILIKGNLQFPYVNLFPIFLFLHWSFQVYFFHIWKIQTTELSWQFSLLDEN